MPPVEPLLIFDLDGTVLRRNSFPLWAASMLGLRNHRLPLRHRVALSWSVQRLLLARRLRRIDHDTLMLRLQTLWQAAVTHPGTTLPSYLQNRLARLVRPNLAPVLRLVAEEVMDGILATAAAGDYAEPLARSLGFTHIIATPARRTAAEPHNSGIHKRDRVLDLLRHREWQDRPRIFFNDDLADLPLMQICQAVCWFGSHRDMRRAKAELPAVRLLPCRAMRPNEMTATIAHLGQSLAAAQLAKMPWVFPASRHRARTVP
jgi:phosphoserine phosphatase